MLDLTPILPWFYATLALVGAGLATWVVLRSQNWLNAHASFLDAQTREKITGMEQDALNAGVAYVVAYAKREGSQVHPVVNSWLLRQGAQVAIDHAAGLLADNGASPDDVANKILAKLPDNVVTTNVNTAVNYPIDTAKVDTSPLPPIQTNFGPHHV